MYFLQQVTCYFNLDLSSKICIFRLQLSDTNRWQTKKSTIFRHLFFHLQKCERWKHNKRYPFVEIGSNSERHFRRTFAKEDFMPNLIKFFIDVECFITTISKTSVLIVITNQHWHSILYLL